MYKLFQALFILFLAFRVGASSAEEIVIMSCVDSGAWEVRDAIEALTGQNVLLRVRPMDGATIRWFQIVPNIDIRYNNAVWPWLPDAYEWKGYDEIHYDRIELSQFHGKWQIELFPQEAASGDDEQFFMKGNALFSGSKRGVFVQEAEKGSFYNHRLGSFWYQAEVRKDNLIVKTPGIESKDGKGLSPKVLRVSIKQGDDLIGELTSYFNVPAVFGSTPYQVKNYSGIDCADVLMAAYCKYSNMPISKDYNVAMLVVKFPTVKELTVVNGRPDAVIRWEKDVSRGDFIAVKYPGGNLYQHIGALYNDNNGNGILDDEDIVLHAGPDPLHFSRLSSGMFDGTVRILRPEEK